MWGNGRQFHLKSFAKAQLLNRALCVYMIDFPLQGNVIFIMNQSRAKERTCCVDHARQRAVFPLREQQFHRGKDVADQVRFHL